MKNSTLLIAGLAALALFGGGSIGGQGNALAGVGAVRRRRVRRLTVSPDAGLPDGPTVQNYIVNPANGNIITEQRYRALYPWTNPATWTYDQASGLWTDHTAH